MRNIRLESCFGLHALGRSRFEVNHSRWLGAPTDASSNEHAQRLKLQYIHDRYGYVPALPFSFID